ncbi:MAG: response regulator [Brevundimonas sp.]|nr:MAG: response regulator [Brevundimonas sp.]
MPEPTDIRATVLMVEDNAEVLMFGATVLEEGGYAVITATSADEALRRIHAGERIDLLFTDVVMPGGLDGAALAVAVGELRPGTPVLLTTGWAERAAELVGDREPWPLIGKPYRSIDLLRKVEALLAGK